MDHITLKGPPTRGDNSGCLVDYIFLRVDLPSRI